MQERTCHTCHGRGLIEASCQTCNGTGSQPGREQGQFTPCAACGGSRMAPPQSCYTCGGSGRLH